jgi:hypothetical protein
MRIRMDFLGNSIIYTDWENRSAGGTPKIACNLLRYRVQGET